MNKYIEYTQVRNLNRKELNSIIDFVNEHQPRALVVQAGWSSVARRKLNKDIKVVGVGGLPYCNLDNILNLLDDVDEFDMVIPIKEYYMNNNLLAVSDSISKVRKQLGKKKILKVIIETSFIYNREYTITELTKCAEDFGANVISTNTGLFNLKYTDKDKRRDRFFDDLVSDVIAIKQISSLKIKASGMIRTKEQAQQLVDLGVNYIGTSGRFWV